MRIATLVPTYKRADKLQKFVEDFGKVSSESTLYFIISPDDKASWDELERLGQNYFVTEGEYVAAINYGFKFTEEEFVCSASDDVTFNEDWDTTLLKMADENPDKHIFGGIDSWLVSRTMKHISHPFIRRSHFTSPLYYPGYLHFMCDIEFEQRGFKEDCVMITPQILIEHLHTLDDGEIPANWDATYQRSYSKIDQDKSLYDRRKGEFEVWSFEDLRLGRIVPTKLNPIYNKTLFSIVIPTFNDADFLKQCIQSIVDSTYYRFEIIIINNGSDENQKTNDPGIKINTKEFLDSLYLGDQSCKIKVVNLEENLWVNPAWNMGAEMATGDYIAIINADITMSKDWDKYLVSALENPTHKYTISCPYETNPHRSKPYALDEWFMKHVPHMLKGPCFAFRKSDVPKLFPIPEPIKHWCGDNWLADKANELGGVIYARKAQIYHYITQSGKRMKASRLTTRTYQDVLEYERLTGKDMGWIKETFPEVVREYHVDTGLKGS